MYSIKILNSEAEGYSKEAESILSSLGHLKQGNLNRTSLIEIISEYDVLIVRLGNNIDKEIIDAGVNLKAIVTATTGLNHIDVTYANEKNVNVISLKGEYEFLKNISATSEHTIGLLLSLLRNIPAASKSVKNGNWNRNLFKGKEISGKRFGILGYGRIGVKVAKYAKAFGAKVIVYDIKKIPPQQEDIIVVNTIDELLENCDILSIHLPFDESTSNLIDKYKINKMPETGIIINTSRGEIINEMDLLESLESSRISGVALDVLADEHMNNSIGTHPLIEYSKNHDNLIITPHIGGATYESMHETEMFIASKVSQWIKSMDIGLDQ